MKTLALCIPTYKRPELLRRCILSAIASAQGRPVAIHVADDSMDQTNSLVREELEVQHPFVHWHVNAKNLGIDRNIQYVVDVSGCDYAWLSGEDDFFLPGAVARVHDFIQTTDAPFIFANYAYVGEDPLNHIGTALPQTSVQQVPSLVFLHQHLWAVGFIGACVIRHKAWFTTDPAPYDGTYFTHVGRLAELIAGQDSVPVITQSCVANRVEGEDNFTWRTDSYGVFFGFLKMCQVAGQRAPALAPAMAAAAMAFESRYQWLSLRLAIRLRSEKAFDYQQYCKYLRGLKQGRLKSALFVVVSRTPPSLLRPLVVGYRILRNARATRRTS